ncbi:MAG: IS630 family transposase [Leptospiraceae bacterium]|nr:IS630 family transposase [Leptospiraceae bacterium]
MKKIQRLLIENCNEKELETSIQCTPTGKNYIRLCAIYDLLNGLKRKKILLKSRVSERTLQYWVRLYIEKGIDGLITKPKTGRPKILDKKDKEFIIDILENPNKAKETHWTGIKLHGYLKDKLKKKASYSTLIRELHLADYKLKIPRKMPAQQEEEKRKAFKIGLEMLLKDDSNEIWFGDETGIEGDPRPRKRWVKKNQKPHIPYFGKHIRANVLGAICPATGEISALIFDYCDTLSFQVFLDQLAEQTKERAKIKKIILILDNATWHKSSKLNWHHITPFYLPPYSPDFNPIERLWLRFKKDFFSDFVAKSPKELYNRICRAIRFYIKKPTLVMETCKIRNSF